VIHIGVAGTNGNSYHCYDDPAQADLLTRRMLNIWHQLGYAIEQPLFEDAPREWIAYEGTTVVRRMLMVVEDGENETI
jgi:hypothetical protein